jgi:CubicO group peptidase (beta-lactamase class C family)
MKLLGRIGRRFKDLSPVAIREIIAIAVILCIAAALSLPQYYSDITAAKRQKEEIKTEKNMAVAKPEEKGMDSIKLETAAKHFKDTSVLSFLVVRDGSLVFEKYFEHSGNNELSRNNVYSVTKSFISALVGIAVREGYIGSVDDTVEKYLPGYFKQLSDPRWKKITLKHLLTMTPGFCEDLETMTGSEDWVSYTFSLSLNYNPGEEFQYANSASHLLSVILTKATGMSTKDFADKYLFNPLGIVSPEWGKDPEGNYAGYANIYMRPRDMAKFGWLYYSMGKWEGVQVVPEEWVAESTRVQFDLNKEQDTGVENGYGYKWWISSKTGYHTFSALGYGGQSITVIPDLGLEVVITCLPNSLALNDEQREQFLKDYVITSIIN